MWWSVLLVVVPSFAAQTFDAKPSQPKQGQVIFIRGEAAAARLGEANIRLFTQTEGAPLGLMPVSALQKPGKYELEYLDAAGAVVHKQTVTVLDAHYARQNVVLSKEVVELKPAPGEQDAASAFRQNVSDVRYWEEPLRLPVPGCMTSPFGVQRYQNGKPTGDFHAGWDQRGATGVPIHAITGGKVLLARPFHLRGNTVGIDHGQGLESIYMHMSQITAIEGSNVKAGDIIGYVGATGRVTASHLHWTIYANGVPVNPGQWMKLPSCYAAAAKKTARSK
jgi:murein DD-endopeptidase MepM/ murein hydrolase activator NlpD